ncbi:MAG: ZIP family metal transporter, partial [Promethearchaeota archaeon]
MIFNMITLIWIIISTLGMSLIAWMGLITLSVKEDLLRKILLYLVAFSAGALLGGAFLHLIPESINKEGDMLLMAVWLLIGFSLFFLMEQFLQW